MNDKTREILPIHPLREGLLVTLLLAAMAIFGNWVAYTSTSSSFLERIQKDFKILVRGAASLIDADTHESLNSPEQENTPAYKDAVAPLYKLRDALPEVRFIYTTRLVDGKVYFVLDATLVGDKDADGVEDHSFLMDVYDDADSSLIEALKVGEAGVSKKPYTDKWGTFISAYAPIRDASGRAVGVLCIDLNAKDYLDRVSLLYRRILNTLIIELIMSLILGLVVYALRNASLRLLSARQKAEHQLRESIERFEILSRVTNDVVWDWDLKTNRVYWNDALKSVFFYDNDPKGMMVDWWLDKIHPEDRERVKKSFGESIEGAKSFVSEEYRFLKSDHSYSDVLDRGYVIQDPSGKAVRMIGTMIDITERKRAQIEKFQNQKIETMGTLAGGVAHNLNNQLAPLVGYLDLVLRSGNLEPKTREFLIHAQTASKRCVDTVKRLLSFSRPSHQAKTVTDLRFLGAELKKFLSSVLPSTIEVKIDFQEDLLPVLCNESEIQSLLLNMCVNSRDAMKSGGILQILARNKIIEDKAVKHGYPPGPYVQFSVIDNGAGIPEETLPRIFEPFFTTKPKHEGSGLGLTSAFNTVRDHHGWIEVRSELGRGTGFDVYLPAQPIDAIAALEENVETPKGSGQTILIAEDEPPVRQLAETLLDSLGYKFMTTADGVECAEIFKKHKAEISAIMLDMTMPKRTGRDTIKALREINPSTKILAVSGFTSEAAIADLIQEGASGFLSKPYTRESLGRALNKIIS